MKYQEKYLLDYHLHKVFKYGPNEIRNETSGSRECMCRVDVHDEGVKTIIISAGWGDDCALGTAGKAYAFPDLHGRLPAFRGAELFFEW